MNDINKMREEFELKLKYAEMENEMEAKLGIEGFMIVGMSLTQKGKIHGFFSDHLDRAQARKVLTALQPTGKYKVSGKDIELTYELETHRYPKEWQTTLTVSWIWQDYDLSFKMLIDEHDDTLMQYFTPDYYELDSSTIGLYYGAVSPRMKSALKTVRFLSFNCGNVIKVSGRLQEADE